MAPKSQRGQPGHAPTPFQELYGRPSPLYSKVRPCGALAWFAFSMKPQGKTAPQVQPMAYVGHEGNKKYLLWDGRSIRRSRDVTFTDRNWIEYMQEQKPNLGINSV